MNSTKMYFLAMAAFWFVFGMITLFYPPLMNLFQTEAGIAAVTTYSNHIWLHEGFDIVSVSVLLFAVSRETASRFIIQAGAIVASLVTIVIVISIFSTPYWNMLFLVPGVCTLAFAVWGFMLASKVNDKKLSVVVDKN